MRHGFAFLLFLLTLLLSGSEVCSQEGKPKAFDESKFVSFVSLKDIPHESHGIGPKNWTPAEVKTVKSLLLWVNSTCPALLDLAAPDHPLKLCRFSKFRPRGEHTLIATTHSDSAIYFSDLFFEKKNKLWCFVHELVHAADGGRYVAYSPNFVKFALAIINNTKAKHGQPGIQKNPMLHNLDEFLAYGFTETFEQGGDWIPKSVGVELSSPSPQHLAFRKFFSRAMYYFSKEDWTNTITDLQAALKYSPSSPSCHEYLGHCFFRQQKFQQSAEQLLDAITEFGSMGLPETEIHFVRARYHYAINLVFLKKYEVAKEILSRLVAVLDAPTAEQARLAIQECEQNLSSKSDR